MLAGMTAEETKRHNTDHCKAIADRLDAIARGTLYTCPECGEDIDIDDLYYPEAVRDAAEYGDECKCPHCGEEVTLEQTSMYDFLNDALDLEYTVTAQKEYKAARVVVAFGGPTIYADTLHEEVTLYWWADNASYPMTRDAVTELDAALEGLFTEC